MPKSSNDFDSTECEKTVASTLKPSPSRPLPNDTKMKFCDYELDDDGSESEYVESSDLASASSPPVKEKISDDNQNEEAEKESEEEDDSLCDSQQSPSSSVAKIDKLWKRETLVSIATNGR